MHTVDSRARVFPPPQRCPSNTPTAAAVRTVSPPPPTDPGIPPAYRAAKSLPLPPGNAQWVRIRSASNSAANPQRTSRARPPHRAATKLLRARGRTFPPLRIPVRHANIVQSPPRAAPRPPRSPPARPPHENPVPRRSHARQTVSAPHPPYTTGHSKSASASRAAPARPPPTRAAHPPPHSSARAPAEAPQSKPAAPPPSASARATARLPFPTPAPRVPHRREP